MKDMKRVLKKLRLYFEGRRIWKAKMSEQIRIRIIETGTKNDSTRIDKTCRHR